jgi:CheY-like chemotaxis protein
MKRKKSILLVEDNKHDQLFFINALREIENVLLYDIANNGAEALDILANAVILPDLIFMDINMPVMNGVDCLAEINKNPRTKNIPVVILSSAKEKVEAVRELGAKAFLEKQWDHKVRRSQLEQMIHLDFTADSHLANQTFQTGYLAYYS